MFDWILCMLVNPETALLGKHDHFYPLTHKLCSVHQEPSPSSSLQFHCQCCPRPHSVVHPLVEKDFTPYSLQHPWQDLHLGTPKWTQESKLQQKENVECRLCQQACKRSVSGCVQDKRELYSLFLTTGGAGQLV